MAPSQLHEVLRDIAGGGRQKGMLPRAKKENRGNHSKRQQDSPNHKTRPNRIHGQNSSAGLKASAMVL